MINVILNIATSLVATFIYSLISKYFLVNEKHEKETDNIVKVINMIVSLLVYISTLIFLFILSPILTGHWMNISDEGMFNVVKISIGPLMSISLCAIGLAAFTISALIIGKALNMNRKSQLEIVNLLKQVNLKDEKNNL